MRLLIFLHFFQQPSRAQHARFVKLVIQMRVVHVERLALADGAQDGMRDDARAQGLLFKAGAGHIGRVTQPRNVQTNQLVFVGQEGYRVVLALIVGFAAAADQRVFPKMLAQIFVHGRGDLLKADDVGLFGFQTVDDEAAAMMKRVVAVALAFTAQIEGYKLHRCSSSLYQFSVLARQLDGDGVVVGQVDAVQVLRP